MADCDRSETTVFRTAGYRWIVVAIGFLVGAILFVGLSALVLYLVTERGDRFIESERLRSLLALALFISFIAIPAYFLAVAGADPK